MSGRAASLLVAVTGLVLFTSCAFGSTPSGNEVGSINKSQDAVAETTLQSAAQAVQTFASGSGTYTGFNAAAGAQTEPSIHWTDAGAAAQNTVSIRGVTPTTVVLVTMSASGSVLCLGLSNGAQSMGRVDAQSGAQCTGGW